MDSPLICGSLFRSIGMAGDENDLQAANGWMLNRVGLALIQAR